MRCPIVATATYRSSRRSPQSEPKGSSMSNDDSSDDEDNKDQHQFKIILLGDGAVGKTSIAMRFVTTTLHSNTSKL